MRYSDVSYAICALLLAGAPGLAEDKIGSMPWHLADVFWEFEKSRPFEKLEIDFHIDGDADTEVRLYISPVSNAKLSGTSLYGGVQTWSDGFTGEGDRRRKYIRKGGIFSRWNERRFEAIRKVPTGLCESGGYEGDFISVRNHVPWTKGDYTYRLEAGDTETVEDKSYTWVSAFVKDRKNDKDHLIGSLRFEGKDLELSSRMASFVEIYGRRIPVETIPKAAITFGGFRVNGKPIEPKSAFVYFPENSPDYAKAQAEGKKVRIEIGEPVKRNKFRVRLF